MGEDRRIEMWPLADLAEHPGNPKAHDLDTITASVGRFGMVDPIILDQRTGRIISGHGRTHTLIAMEKRGDSPPDGIGQDEQGRWLAPVVVGWSSHSDSEADAAVIALNRTTELGGWVDQNLLDMLDRLQEQDQGLVGVGYGDDDIMALRERLAELGDESDDPLGEDDDRYGDGRGELLDIADLSAGEPDHQVHHGDHWIIDTGDDAPTHHLVVANPHREWQSYIHYLEPGSLLAPYPDVWLTCSDAGEQPLVLVQPVLYLAGHLLDKHASVHPDHKIIKADA